MCASEVHPGGIEAKLVGPAMPFDPVLPHHPPTHCFFASDPLVRLVPEPLAAGAQGRMTELTTKSTCKLSFLGPIGDIKKQTRMLDWSCCLDMTQIPKLLVFGPPHGAILRQLATL